MATTICQLTEKAKTYLQQRKPKDGYVKLGVDGGGWAGFSYKWDTTDEVGDGKLVDDILVVDPLTELYIIGSTIDYVEEVFGSYLKISNPMATSSCGCGESFGV